MKVLYYDCFCGISGDMNLGALIDLGVPKEYLIDELQKLNMEKEFKLEIRKGEKCGITGVKVDVILENEHKHEHKHHGHSHGHEHHHRTFADVKKIISNSNLSDSVKKISIDIFFEVAIAEAKVHGKTIDEVHFHEVGAVDSIVDIVGAGICLDYLKVDKVYASSVQVGGGFVKCAHGVMPVPAPATAEILKDVPTKSGLVEFETTTPTGAGILKASVSKYTDNLEIAIEKIGYGLGTRDLEVPNILRAYIGTARENAMTRKERQFILETNIDDMNSELFNFTEKLLFENGALDVYKTPIIMKKGRPAVKLSVLFDGLNRAQIQDVIFKNTTVAGVREYAVDKYMLEREFSYVATKFGKVKVKNLFYNGEFLRCKPEYDDCEKIAYENAVSINDVYDLVREALNNEKI